MNLTDKFVTTEQNNPIRTLAIMTNEWGSLATCLTQVNSYEEARIELADMVIQCIIMSEQLQIPIYQHQILHIGDSKVMNLFYMAVRISKLSRCIIYSGKGDNTMHPKPSMLEGYLKDASIHIGAIEYICREIAKEMKWDWSSLIEDGEERFIYRMEEIKRREI